MKCIKCKTELPEAAKFCHACGAEQPKPEPVLKEPAQLPPVMTVAELASALKVSRPQVYILIERDGLPFTTLGSHKRFIWEDVLAWLKSRTAA